MGRAPAFWTEENTKLIRENLVAVSLSVSEYDRTDAVGQFLRDSGLKLSRLEGCLWGEGGEELMDARYQRINILAQPVLPVARQVSARSSFSRVVP